MPELKPRPVSLERLAAHVGGRVAGRVAEPETVHVSGITHDSRAVAPGDLFCCVVGKQHDGHGFAADALATGAGALLVERELELDAAQIVVRCVRAALGPAANELWDHPSRRMQVVGITGTAGKTTVAHVLSAIARACGTECAVFGTLDGGHTTAEAPELVRSLAQAAHDGAQMAAIEVSSHALEMGRVDGIEFAAGVFTNLGHEHLDFHQTMDQYFAAKARLFDGRCAVAVVNTADPWGRRLTSIAAEAGSAVVGWQPDDLSEVTVSRGGLNARWRGRPIRCGLIGRVNAANVAAAAATAGVLRFDDEDIAAAISSVTPVRGRLWPVSAACDDVTVLVDFAHKPDALDAALDAGGELLEGAGRLWAVFGAGGDRDRSKRALMGAAADSHADVIVLTSDNPRSEDPADIAAQIAEGMDSGTELHVELDRRAAIGLVMEQAEPDDVVVIAGKGHETHQVGPAGAVAFDDSEVAAAALAQRRNRRP